MTLTRQIAKLLRDAYAGGNWTAVNLKDTLADVNWQAATTRVQNFNTIAELVYHINYYVRAVLAVLQDKQLEAHDRDSFNLPPMLSEEDWQKLLESARDNAERLAGLIEVFPESRLFEIFVAAKYGTYFRNFHGVIEHAHYHLGQIVLIKKMLPQSEPDDPE